MTHLPGQATSCHTWKANSSPCTITPPQPLSPILSPISFQGRLEHSVDEQGRLFIDRDPELFAVLLQFMRASTTPPQSHIRANRESLLEECRFFGVDAARFRGHTWTSDLSPQDRRIKKQEYEARSLSEAQGCFLLDVFRHDASPVEPTDLGLQIFRRYKVQ